MGKIVFKRFVGEPVKVIPQLIKENYEIASVADIMDIRIADDLRNKRVNTVDGIAYDKYGNIKLVLDCDYLKNINLESKMYGGALKLKYYEFDDLRGDNVFEIPYRHRLSLKKYNKEVLTFLARGEKRLNDYVEATSDIMKKNFGDKEIMRFNLDSKSNYCKLRPIAFEPLSAWSYLSGTGNFRGGSMKRFVGIRR